MLLLMSPLLPTTRAGAAVRASPAGLRPYETTKGARFACGRRLVVRYNPRGAPARVEPDLRRAVAALGTALHRDVGYGGNTEARSVDDATRGRVQTILVRWVAARRQLAASGPVGMIATGTSVRSGRRLLAGEVVLAADALAASRRRRGGIELVLRHELAHAVGVDHHSPDPRDVLFPGYRRTKTVAWGPGDRAALAAVGCPHR